MKRFSCFALAALIGCYLVASVVIACHGYGDDGDSYFMLRTWQTMLVDGRYVPSRFQGNIIPEFIIGFLASQFGSYGPNAFSIALSLMSALFAVKILAAISSDTELIGWAIATVLLNPTWILEGSTSVDYLYPIAVFLGGIFLLMRGRPTLAALAFALAAGSRISYVPLGVTALGVAEWKEPERCAEFTGAILAYLMVGGLFYLPVLISSHLSLSFLDAGRPLQQGVVGLLVRFVYKLHQLYGFVGTYVVLGLCAFSAMRKRISLDARSRFVEGCAVGVIAFHLLLFLWIPVLVAYLLPVLLAVAALFVTYRLDRRALVAVALLEVLTWFVRIEPLAIRHETDLPCRPVNAVAAVLHPHLAEGWLLERLDDKPFKNSCWMSALLIVPSNPYVPLPPAPFRR